MTSLFEEALAEAGVRIEIPIVEYGTRGCAIGQLRDNRVLATIAAASLPAELTRVRPGWDLDVRAIEPIETSSGPRRAVIEHLPLGVPSIGSGAPDLVGDTAPPFVAALADRIAREHEHGKVVGPVHPRLVFVDPRTSTFVAFAQRPIRIGGVPAVEGDGPLFGLGYLAPNELRGGPQTPADDVHRLAAVVWTWRHGAAPFSGLPETSLIHFLAGAPADASARGLPFDDPRDELDAVLARALRPSGDDHPTAREITDAIVASGTAWRTA